jgi:hypothetical protein
LKTILSNRYGSKCLRSKIHPDDYHRISEKLNQEERQLLNDFYDIDENSVKDKVYMLKSEKEMKNLSSVKFFEFI